MTAPVELVRELLYYRDMRMIDYRDWGLITAFLAGSSFAFPIFAPFAVGSLVALGIEKIRNMRKKHAIAGIVLPPPSPSPGSTTLYGIARRFRGTIPSLIDDHPVLLEQAVVRDRHGAVLLRRTETTPFLLEVEHKGTVLVTGITRVKLAALSQRSAVGHGDPRLTKMGVPEDLAVTGDLEIASIAADGPGLSVTGILEDEAVAELAFHRDGGRTPVMRGRIGAPVIVEDPRLIAAAL
jgi:hypothetical protein